MDLYSTTDLIGVIDTVVPQENFWLGRYFPDTVNFTTEEIAFDKIAHNRTLAPFVAPNVQGKPNKQRGYTTNTFKPAYIKPKDPITPSQMFTRRAGEALGSGTLSPAERWDAAVAAQIAEHRRAIERRWEWMAAQAAMFASVTVAGEDYPSVTVDFGRNPANRITLSGTARWGQSAAAIEDNLEAWASQIFTNGGGLISDVIVSPDVWAVMRKDPAIIALFETRRGSQSSGEVGPLNGQLVQKVCTIGQFNVWTYSDTYIDSTGASAKFMPAGSVFMGNPANLQGIQAFGAILDVGAGLQPLSIFPKMWNEQDPSATFIMSQSAPLMIPRNPDATLFASVL